MTQTLMVKLSPALKDEIGKAAAQADLNMSEFVRQCVADKLGYDLGADDALDARGRPRTYQTEEQRRAARKKNEREREQNKRNIVELLMRKERLKDIAALEKYLRDRGVSLEDDSASETETELSQSA